MHRFLSVLWLMCHISTDMCMKCTVKLLLNQSDRSDTISLLIDQSIKKINQIFSNIFVSD